MHALLNIGFCHKISEIHFLWTVDQLSEECKNLDAVVFDQLLAANVDTIAYQMEKYKNPGLVVILHFLNSF